MFIYNENVTYFSKKLLLVTNHASAFGSSKASGHSQYSLPAFNLEKWFLIGT